MSPALHLEVTGIPRDSGGLRMSSEEHTELQTDLIGLARDLRECQTPDNFLLELDDVRLNGDMPADLATKYGFGQTAMRYAVEVDTAKTLEDASVSVTFDRGAFGLPVAFRHEQEPAGDSGHGIAGSPLGKRFTATSIKTDALSGAQTEEVLGEMNCDEVWRMIGSNVSKRTLGQAVAELADPRAAYPFNHLALATGEILRKVTTHEQTTRSFHETDSRIDIPFAATTEQILTPLGVYINDIGAQLVLQQSRVNYRKPRPKARESDATIKLITVVPTDLGSNQLTQAFVYTFKPYGKLDPRIKAPNNGQANIYLLGPANVPRRYVEHFLQSTRKELSAIGLASIALDKYQARIRASDTLPSFKTKRL